MTCLLHEKEESYKSGTSTQGSSECLELQKTNFQVSIHISSGSVSPPSRDLPLKQKGKQGTMDILSTQYCSRRVKLYYFVIHLSEFY